MWEDMFMIVLKCMTFCDYCMVKISMLAFDHGEGPLKAPSIWVC